VAWSSDGKWLASGSHDKTVRVWDALSGKLVRTLEGHTLWVLRVAWSSDSKWLISVSMDNSVASSVRVDQVGTWESWQIEHEPYSCHYTLDATFVSEASRASICGYTCLDDPDIVVSYLVLLC